jgi:hypothetical protein
MKYYNYMFLCVYLIGVICCRSTKAQNLILITNEKQSSEKSIEFVDGFHALFAIDFIGATIMPLNQESNCYNVDDNSFLQLLSKSYQPRACCNSGQLSGFPCNIDVTLKLGPYDPVTEKCIGDEIIITLRECVKRHSQGTICNDQNIKNMYCYIVDNGDTLYYYGGDYVEN